MRMLKISKISPRIFGFRPLQHLLGRAGKFSALFCAEELSILMRLYSDFWRSIWVWWQASGWWDGIHIHLRHCEQCLCNSYARSGCCCRLLELQRILWIWTNNDTDFRHYDYCRTYFYTTFLQWYLHLVQTGALNTATVPQAVLATSNGRGGGQWDTEGSTSFGSSSGGVVSSTAMFASTVVTGLAAVLGAVFIVNGGWP